MKNLVNSKYFTKIKYILFSLNFNYLIYIFSITITLIPLFFWGDRKFIGGDDTMLYYFYPYEYLIYTLRIISDNTAGALGSYYSQGQLSPTILFLLILNKIGFSQNLILGLNLALGYLFFTKLLILFRVKNKSIILFTSLLYPFSTFIYLTSFSSFFPSLFLIPVLPFFLYYFISGLTQDKNYKIIISSIIFSLFSALISNIAYIFAFIIASIPLLLFLFREYKKDFLQKIILFSLSSILFSFYYLAPTVDSVINKSQFDVNTINRVLSNDDTISIEINENIIKSVTNGNTIFFPLIGMFHRNIQFEFNWYSLEFFDNYYMKLIPLNLALLLIIISSIILSNKNNNIIFFSFFSLVITVYFFTGNVGNLGLDIFLNLNNTVPGFAMFRNMYDKFAIPMSFYFAFTLSLATNHILYIIKEKYRKYFYITVVSIVLLNIYPFVIGNLFHNKPFRSTENIFDRIYEFNSDFNNMIAYIKNLDKSSGRILWLPVTESNYVAISGNEQGRYYFGMSPILILTGMNDFNSDMSFFLTSKNSLVKKIDSKEYEEAAKFLQKNNVEYLIVNKDLNDKVKNSYIFNKIDSENITKIEESSFFKKIGGEKLMDFGDRYSIYRISSKFDSKKIYLSENNEEILNENLQEKITFEKISYYKYKVILKNYINGDLNFLEPYHKGWCIYINNNCLNIQHELLFNYANTWKLDYEFILKNIDKNSYSLSSDGVNIEFEIFFKPKVLQDVSLIISLFSLFISTLYIIHSLIKIKKSSFVKFENYKRII